MYQNRYSIDRENRSKKVVRYRPSFEWKIKNLDEITSRMKGWQLETFKESYNHKLRQGISLYKKSLLEK